MAEEIEIIVTATGFDKVSTGLKNTSDALKTTATEAKKTGDALKSNLNAGSAQAGQSLQNLSRIAQDAPFGFIGIANNINPLVESFGRLKAETGSTGGALKALVSGLSGPAGLGLAFGVVTAAISFAQIGFQAWSRGSKDAKENSDLFKKDLEELKRELSAVTDELNNFISVAESSAKLNDINIVARFEDKTEQGVLQRQSKFITISEELVKATDARAEAYQNYLNVLNGSFKSEDERNQAEKAALDIYNQLIKKEKELSAARELQAAANRAATIEEKRAAEAKANSSKKTEKAAKAIETFNDIILKSQENIADQKKFAILFDTKTTKEQLAIVKQTIESGIRDFNLPTNDARILVLKALLTDLEAKQAVEDGTNKIQEKIKSKIGEGKLTIKVPVIITPDAVIQVAELQKALQKSFQIIGVGLGEGIANAITEGANFGDVFLSIFQQLGGVVQALGEQILAIGIAAVVASDSLKAIFANPYAAIAAGIALVALGALIKNTTTPRNRFAVGTRNAPGGMALVGERGPEMISLPRGSQVLPAAQTANMMGGVGGAVEIYGILRGQDIYFSNKKYSATYARTT
jgi:uncharacterized protein YfkK (UPF0435 family)